MTEGVYAYFQEIEHCRTVCRRYEGIAAVYADDNILQVTRFFEKSCTTEEHLLSTLQSLTNGPERHRRQPKGCQSQPSSVVHQGIVWENRAILVHAYTLRSALLRVDLHVPASASDLPELQLRIVADVLRCHEFLIPELTAMPLPIPPEQRANLLGIREYLMRTMPQNLYASQCI